MALKREEIHKLVDQIPDNKLSDVEKYLKIIHNSDNNIKEEEPTEEEKKIIEEALKEYEKGEYYTFEEVFGDDKDV